MVRARVELQGCRSFARGKRTFLQNQPLILTDEDEINYYRGDSNFSVKMLVEQTQTSEPKVAPVPKVSAPVEKKEDAPEPEEEEKAVPDPEEMELPRPRVKKTKKRKPSG